LVKALDQLDAVIALIRGSASAEEARTGLMELLDVDEVQATAILDMQLRKLAALERRKTLDDLAKTEAEIADYHDILASEVRQRSIVGTELKEIVDKHGDERRSVLIPFDGEVSMEDLIAEEDIVVTISAGGYAKRTRIDHYRAQRRGGKGIIGAQLRQDDVVEHFFVTTTHHWLLFFTDKGRVYRAKAYELPEAARSARGQHVANLLAFQPDETIAQVLALHDYEVAPYLVLATRAGLVKKTPLRDFDSNRSGGVIAINLHDDDAVISARLVSADDDLLLISRRAQSIRFRADDEALRPMGRATSGVIGMRFKDGDELLAMMVVRPGAFVLTATDAGYAKRTPIEEYPRQGRGGHGVLTAKLTDDRGGLVGALMVDDADEVFAITSAGGVIRTRADEVRATSRATMGVRLINLADGDAVVGVTRNAESAAGVDDDEPDGLVADGQPDADNGDAETGSVTESAQSDPADQSSSDETTDPEQAGS
jgi:DNA gyrase subunit A